MPVFHPKTFRESSMPSQSIPSVISFGGRFLTKSSVLIPISSLRIPKFPASFSYRFVFSSLSLFRASLMAMAMVFSGTFSSATALGLFLIAISFFFCVSIIPMFLFIQSLFHTHTFSSTASISRNLNSMMSTHFRFISKFVSKMIRYSV